MATLNMLEETPRWSVVQGDFHSTEGEIVVALDDNGLPPQSPERFRIYGDVPYDFYHQRRFVRSYTFPFDLLYPSYYRAEEV